MKFEPIEYEMIIALNIKRVFYICEDTEEGITFEQLKKSESKDAKDYLYWDSLREEWVNEGYDIDPDKRYYILTKD